MKVQIISLLLTSFLLFQSGAKDSYVPPVPYDEAEAYEVYSALLQSEWFEPKRIRKKVIIRIETITFEMCLEPDPESEKIIGPAIADYIRKNEKSVILQKQFHIKTRIQETTYELITDNKIQAIFKQGDWGNFYKLYPDSDGFIDFSAVGFNKEKTVAVVYMAHHCDNLCGSGMLHVLQKKDGKWQPLSWQGSSCGWIS